MAKAITDAIDALEKKPEESNKDTTDDENEKTEVTGDAASSVVDTAISEDAEIKNAAGETVDSSEVKVQVKTSSEETIAEVKELVKKNEITVSENAVTKFFDIELVDGSGAVVKLSNGLLLQRMIQLITARLMCSYTILRMMAQLRKWMLQLQMVR